MFKKDSQDTKRHVQSPSPTPTAQKLQTVVGDGTRINGEIKVDGDLRVDGEIEGMITVTGSVVVGKSGLVKADMEGGTAEIAGRVVGKISARDRVILLGGSRLEGDVQSQSLKIEDGAYFQGNCVMGDKEVKRPSVTTGDKGAAPKLTLAEGGKG